MACSAPGRWWSAFPATDVKSCGHARLRQPRARLLDREGQVAHSGRYPRRITRIQPGNVAHEMSGTFLLSEDIQFEWVGVVCPPLVP